MIVWRVLRSEHANEPLSGLGAYQAGGRWNSRNVSVVYTASSLSVCLLEILAAYLPTGKLPPDLVAAKIITPDEAPISAPPVADLPKQWRDPKRPGQCQAYGDHWVKRRDTLALKVPSVTLTPAAEEFTCLLNPSHPDFAKVRVDRILDPELDLRLLPAPAA